MKRALIAATNFFLMLFAAGFALGAIRVSLIAPRLGQLAATFVEIPVMLAFGFFASHWVLRHWQVPASVTVRCAMAGWFLVLLFGLETLFGVALFGRSLADQWALLVTPAGLLGVSAQLLVALFPVLDLGVGHRHHRRKPS